MEFSMKALYIYSILLKEKENQKKRGKKKGKKPTSKHRNLWYTVLVYKIGVTQMVSCTYNAPPFKY